MIISHPGGEMDYLEDIPDQEVLLESLPIHAPPIPDVNYRLQIGQGSCTIRLLMACFGTTAAKDGDKS